MQSKYVTREELEQLKNAISLKEPLQVALGVLKRMNEDGLPIYQVCGPMTTGGFNNFRQNMKFFRLAIKKAQEKNEVRVFDQLVFTHSFILLFEKRGIQKEYWIELIDDFYGELFRSGYMKGTYWLPKWETSTGARREREIAIECNMLLEEYPKEWLKEIAKESGILSA